MPNTEQLLKDVMVKLEKQFMVPAVYTLKSDLKGQEELHVFLHGTAISHYCSIDFLEEMVTDNEEYIRKVNKVSDYFIDFFIVGMKQESESEVVHEVMKNLSYLYGKTVKPLIWQDEQTKEILVSIVPFKPELAVTMTAKQLKEEYENRYATVDSPDILIDMKDIIKVYEDDGVVAAKTLAEKLDRNIQVSTVEENEQLKKAWY